MNLEKEINVIKKRNLKVEADKAWEISFTRKVSIASLTYLAVAVFLLVNNFEKPFINAIVPAIGFLLSTLSLSFLKSIWIKKYI